MGGVRDLEEAYHEAEEAIRRVEVYTKKVPVPAVNEMRYAGYHALRHLIVEEDGEKAREREGNFPLSPCLLRRAKLSPSNFVFKGSQYPQGTGQLFAFFCRDDGRVLLGNEKETGVGASVH